MFKNILVPVDGSATADRGLAQAVALARDQGSALTILHVVDESSLYRNLGMGGSPYYLNEARKAMATAGRSLLDKAVAAAKAKGARTTGILVESALVPVADIIARQAKKSRADLIVLGTHGRRGISRLVMGSDAEGVLRQSTVPVVLVRAPQGSVRRKSPAGAKAKSTRRGRAATA
jgi:nucleotide-binding universal stress UspA family protein